MFGMFRKIFGTVNDRIIKSYRAEVLRINALAEEIVKLTDPQLQNKTIEFKQKLANGATLDDIAFEAFAVTREASKRVSGKRHFDEQLMGGLVLHKGKIAEMKTGEGKTLTATLPSYLNALSEKPVHLVTVNDYLAKRDAEWMGDIYKFLGISVASITNSTTDIDRKKAYASDIIYGTNTEFSFDFLRDNMKFSLADKVQRPEFYYAIVDEVDSILIDEARTPLVISGAVDDNSALYKIIDRLISKITAQHYEKEEKSRSIHLTDDGVNKIEELLKQSKIIDPETGLYDFENMHLIHYINQSLKAHNMFKIDVDYIVQNKQVLLIDEFTGRVMSGRRFSEGLHQALEAKENVPIQNENQTLASITFQNYFRMYKKLAGMTGTAITESEEFKAIYKLDVISIPPHRKVIRVDKDDAVYGTKQEKNDAIVSLVKELFEKGQPVLIGTTNIQESEEFSKLFKNNKIEHSVLNAKYHEQEAQIIAQAGRFKAVTIATNMAGRGTDIILGGNTEMLIAQLDENELSPVSYQEEIRKIEDAQKFNQEKVLETGGLFVLGTARHESRRIDNQLRGRSGRQGDPGVTQFFLSLEDDLMRIFASDKISGLLRRLGLKDGEAIQHSMINSAISKAQTRVESYNYDIRKSLLKFDDVMNEQRKIVYSQRNSIITAEDFDFIFSNFAREVLEGLVNNYLPENSYQEDWDLESLTKELYYIFAITWDKKKILEQDKIENKKLIDDIEYIVHEAYKNKKEIYGAELVYEAFRYILIVTLDKIWKDHLHQLDHLRQGISLRAYGQKDPLSEYKREAFQMFDTMLTSFPSSVLEKISHLHLDKSHRDVKSVSITSKTMPKIQTGRNDIISDNQYNPDGHNIDTVLQASRAYVKNEDRNPNDSSTWGKILRNELCPCGSGKKYKHCHG